MAEKRVPTQNGAEKFIAPKQQSEVKNVPINKGTGQENQAASIAPGRPRRKGYNFSWTNNSKHPGGF